MIDQNGEKKMTKKEVVRVPKFLQTLSEMRQKWLRNFFENRVELRK